MPCVGGFMPSPDALAPAPASIDFRQGLAERQHTVIARQVERPDRIRIGHGAMMGVMEQPGEIAPPRPDKAVRADQRRFVPFLHEEEVGAVAQRDQSVLHSIALVHALWVATSK